MARRPRFSRAPAPGTEPGIRRRTTTWRGLAAGVAGAAALVAGCGTSTTAQTSASPGPPPASIGTVLDAQVPAAVADAPLTDDSGRTTSLAAFRGKTVVLADFLTLCQDICPMISANIAQMDKAVAAAHLTGQVQFVELTVDPQRDTPARLSAYRKLFDASPNWSFLTASPAVTAQVWKNFGAWYQKTDEDSPAGLDWWTGQKLTYDVDHQDVLIYLDTSGHERFLIQGPPNTQNHLPPAKLDQFLNQLGRTHLKDPAADSWTTPQALQPLSWLTGANLHVPS
jgi:protein SCO1/2